MKFARFEIANKAVLAIENGDGWIDYGEILSATHHLPAAMAELSARWITYFLTLGLLDPETIRKYLEEAGSLDRFTIDINEATPLLPVRPGKFVCVARNWEEHAREGGNEFPDRPVYFGKSSNCAIGYGQAIEVPTFLGRVDHEGELGVVIGKKAKYVRAENAWDYIHSLTIVNDVTAREFQRELAANKWPWYAAKSLDTFAPVGPHLISPDEAGHLDSKRIIVKVNDQVKQDGSLNDMHWKIPELMQIITRTITLDPGDILSTGTPSGVGAILPGDTVTVEIDGIGKLVNPVIEAE